MGWMLAANYPVAIVPQRHKSAIADRSKNPIFVPFVAP
jgi:hypothetical protein